MRIDLSSSGTRAWIARALEHGDLRGPAIELASSVWSRHAGVVRAICLPARVRTICVGGATLGGSGRTPVAIACARHVVSAGARVALIGHAYRGRVRTARVVTSRDDAAAVGDEAKMCARLLAHQDVRVVVGPTRQAAADHVAASVDVLVFDGVAQLAPVRATLAILVRDHAARWSDNACPPRGDLRASRGALLAACDRIVDLGEPISRGAYLGSDLIDWPTLARTRVALWTSIAHPERVHRLLAARGVEPVVTIETLDHVVPSAREWSRARDLARERGATLWLAPAKSSALLERAHIGELPVASIDHDVDLPPELLSAIADCAR